MKLLFLQRVFLVLIVVGCLYSSIQNLISTQDLGSTTDDPVADWEIRFKAVKSRLPFQRGVIGYISDSDVPGVAYDAANDEGEYVLTQFAMAPNILARGTSQEWSLANLSDPAYAAWNANHQGIFQVTPLKGGIYLLRRTGP